MNRTIISRLLPLLLLAAIAAPAAARVDTRAVTPAAVAQRISGDKDIAPDALTASMIARTGRRNVVGVFNVCIDQDGAVADITTVRSTSFASYDAAIARQIRGWRYQPVLREGQPAAACTTVTLLYQQK